MKRINFKSSLITIALCALVVSFLCSCDSMNSLHEEYLERGAGIYLGPVEAAMSYPGYNKVKLIWAINADPRITKAVIYWNQRDKSKTVPVNRTNGEYIDGFLIMETDVEGLEEGDFIFEIIMQDDKGNFSKPYELSGTALGESFMKSLITRGIKEIMYNVDVFEIIWEDVSSATLQSSVVQYELEGNLITLEVPNDETVTPLPGLDTGNEINVFSIHIFGNEYDLDPLDSYFKSYFIPRRLRNITDDVLKNTKQPIVTVPGSGMPGNTARFLKAADWVHDGDMNKGYTVDANAPGGAALSLYTNGGADYNFANGKLYQTVTLPAGTYRFDARVIRTMCDGVALKIFMVVASGEGLPDFDNVATQSLGRIEVVTLSEVPAGNIPEISRPTQSIEFELTSEREVSLGFVGRASANFLTIFEKVELWSF